MKKLTVIGINGYTQGVRQVAKPMPKAIKKKLNNDFSSSGFSAELMVEIEVSEETATGVEIASFTLSVTFSVVGITFSSSLVNFSVVVCVPDNLSTLSFTWFSAWSSLFFFQNPNLNQLLLPI